MKWKVSGVSLLMLLVVSTAFPARDKKPDRKLKAATEVYQRLMNAPDGEVPQALLGRARCVVVIPHVVKAALIYGGRHGTGVVSCRNDAGSWSPPSFMSLSGGSIGFQIGAQATDHVLFIMNELGVHALLRSKFALGADGSVAAGPLGRTAELGTDVTFRASIYSYARAKGLFAGISLEGARLAQAGKYIEAYYGERLDPAQILFERRTPRLTQEARDFLRVLPHRSPTTQPLYLDSASARNDPVPETERASKRPSR
ncbi:MAG: lipid-binding SYLF domain-containing protein [Acidobacteriota bacterium]